MRFGVTDDARAPVVRHRSGCGSPDGTTSLNATAVLDGRDRLGMPPERRPGRLTGFARHPAAVRGQGEAGGVRVYDDYAHHPTEVAVVLRAARGVAGDGRVVTVFQPHLYSRTRIFAEEFGRALGLADEVVVMDVYAAREDPEPGVTGAMIAAAGAAAGRAGELPAVVVEGGGRVAARSRPGDLVLTVGAGDVTMLAPEILNELRERSG